MAKSFKVSIVTPEKTAYEADVVSAILPGSVGYLGIWANHAPIVTALQPGVVTLREHERSSSGDAKYFSVTGGFLEFSANRLTLLCDACEPAGEIDINRAKAALERAQKRLRAHEKDVDLERARQAAERAEARLKAAYLREGAR